MLNIHLGPHKTATTYLQSVMKNSEWLPGYRYFDIFESRREVLSQVRDCAEGELPACMSDSSLNYVYSDENLIGGPQGPLNMYPQAASSLKWSKGHKPNLFFALRPYHEIYVSSWLESLRFSPFFKFREGPAERGYVQVLEEIDSYVEPGTFTLWMYSDFRDHPEEIINMISGGGIKTFGEHDSGSERLSPTRQEVDLYTKVVPYVGRKFQAEVFNIIRNSMTVKSEEKFQPFSESDIDRLKDRFLRDVEIIRDKFGIWQPAD